MINLWTRIKNVDGGESNERRGENGDFSWTEVEMRVNKRSSGVENE